MTRERPDIDRLHEQGMVTGAEAARIVGMTYRQVDHLARKGVVTPTLEAEGSGTLRGYTISDIVRLKMVADLHAIGIMRDRHVAQLLDGDRIIKNDSTHTVVSEHHARFAVVDAFNETLQS